MVALRRSRRQSRVIAIALTVLTFLGTGGSWHVDADDPDCAIDIVAHSHSAHDARLAAPDHRSTPVHCAICHWLQAFRADAVRHARVQFDEDVRTARLRIDVESIRTGARIDLPSRAPPVSL
jgi:hypothetical protein